MDADNRIERELHEPGFDGSLVIEIRDETRLVHILGTRPPDDAAVAKDVPADRDPELEKLVGLVVAGDEGAAVRLLAHVGVVDPA
jgi:hypothetical protein